MSNRHGIRPAISRMDAARLSTMVVEARQKRERRSGRHWSQERLAQELGDHLNDCVGRHEVQWLEACPTRPFGRPRHRDLWRAVAIVLDLDKAEINRLGGGI